jgi:hypothetical protein
MTITLTNDTISPALALLRAQAKNPRGIMAAASRSVVNLFRKHLRLLNQQRPNKLGGKRTNMYNQFARSVNVPVLTDTTALISISDPRSAHVHTGGTITAKRAKFLTIPVAPEAYNRRASVLEGELGIKLILFRNAATNSATLVGRLPSGEGFKVYYVLKKSVVQSARPILPDDAQIATAALDAGKAALLRQLKKN